MKIHTCIRTFFLFSSSFFHFQISANELQLNEIRVYGVKPNQSSQSIVGDDSEKFSAPLQISTYSVLESQSKNSRLADFLSQDASLAENFATYGYYENFSIRGFTLDRGSAYRLNGFAIPAEFHLPLDNINQVEVLKGVSSLNGGMVSAGGLINFVSKRPTPEQSIYTEINNYGNRLFSSYVGGLNSTKTIGYGLTFSQSELGAPQRSKGGERSLVGFSVDITPIQSLRVQNDFIYQHRSQLVIPGFQLLGGTQTPDLKTVRDVNIGSQSWAKPVVNEGTHFSTLTDIKISDLLNSKVGFSSTLARIDDNLATPWGCNTSPVQYFCANGDFVVYKYHAQERRQTDHAFMNITGAWNTGPAQQKITLGIEQIKRTISQRDYYSNTIYDTSNNALSNNIYNYDNRLIEPSSAGQDLPVTKSVQTNLALSDKITYQNIDATLAVRLARISQTANLSIQKALPALALSWHFDKANQIYVSHARGMEFGSQAPLVAENSNALLPPRLTQQNEVGWKFKTENFKWSTAIFEMQRPYEYTQVNGSSWAGLGNYIQSGQEIHRGLEANGAYRIQKTTTVSGSLAFIRARANNSAQDNGIQLPNIPKFSSNFSVSHRLTENTPLEAKLEWLYRGERNARRDGTVTVPGYSLFNLALNYQTDIRGREVAIALGIRNLFNKYYWRDVSEAYSADLLFPGERRSTWLTFKFTL
ncbi:TonB-dependent siderophore receptor [Parvibium lacunae]|uniref:Uncharacterized protein n=1 Tax=Parvibium lacunae TaxID=1888893 RepID=A0A368L7V1_9BURK|nr:TonB-dependent receptor [Parvibium lacunae]RCS59687.1 hypothetical protein DU000_02980 [Parvibium lacunae]